jgi:sulfite reductase (NADPH) flavoprotein alpha-component
MSSIFPLHSGSFFGTPGVLAFFLASLAMPVFTITGWMLYLDRRSRKLAANA